MNNATIYQDIKEAMLAARVSNPADVVTVDIHVLEQVLIRLTNKIKKQSFEAGYRKGKKEKGREPSGPRPSNLLRIPSD